MVDMEDLLEEAWDFAIKNWRAALVFLILLALGAVAILNGVTTELKNTEEQIQDESADGIIDAFSEVGRETSKNIKDPATKGLIIFLWWLVGVMTFLLVVLMIAKALEPIYNALNPWNLAKNISRG